MSLPQLIFTANNPNEQRLKDAVNQLILGNASNTGEVTLEANAATTTVTNSRIGGGTKVILQARTANAAAALATTYISAITKGSFTITHANNAQTDRTFDYIHVG